MRIWLLGNRASIVLFAILLLGATNELHGEIEPTELYESTSPAIVRIFELDKDLKPISQGSGFFIADGLIATNFHVINVKGKLVIESDSGVLVAVKRVHGKDQKRDLAVVEVDLKPKALIKVSASSLPKIGEKIYAIGSPLGLRNTLSDGLVSGHRTDDAKDRDLIQISVPISHGSSGGALFDREGRLVGITTSVIEEGQNLNFAVPTKYLIPLIPTGSIRDETETKPSAKLTDDETAKIKSSRVAKLIEAAKESFKEKKDRSEAIRILSTAFRLTPDYRSREGKALHHALRGVLNDDETIYSDAILDKKERQEYTVIVVDFVSDVPLGREVLLWGDIWHNSNHKSTFPLATADVRKFPDDPEAYLVGKVIRAKVTIVERKGYFSKVSKVHSFEVLSK